ncbi:MAG: rRNA maturation RNase YbeY [Solobacterium sp.]|nr:rRNA maturation RNase YbeY [Solobacterium sp.]
MDISFYNRTNADVSVFENYFKRISKRALKVLQKTELYCISVIFVRSRTIHQINKQYRGIDKPTDVITFAFQDGISFQDEGPIDLGDIFINLDYAKRQAKEYGHSFEREVCFLFTHGILHSFGYDHINPKDEQEMNALQDQILDPIIKRVQ